jgi:hypothetical protein
MEVLISAVILALIVIATFTGFDVANQATASERQRAQADVIAQQDEDRLRSYQIGQLSSLSETNIVKYGGTEYSVLSTGEFISDDTGGTSCSTEAQEASYVRTTSKVTWPGSGTRDPVVETGLITPPAGGAVLVQVFEAKGNPLSGVTVKATGPSAATSTTGTQGCVIFAGLAEGEYKVSVHRTGYTDKTGNKEPEESATVVAGNTEKKAFELDQPGAIAVTFEPTSGAEAKGDTFVAQNPELPTPSFKTFGTPGTYETTVTSPMELFPFGEPSPPAEKAIGQYKVYAGTCEADNPETLGAGEPPKVNVLPGETVSVKVPLPAINLKVMSGTESSPPPAVTNGFSGTFKDEGSECGGKEHKFPVISAATGELHKGMSFGKFSLCLVSKEKVGSPAMYKKVKGIAIANEHAAGTALTTIYLGSSGVHEERSFPAYTCP